MSTRKYILLYTLLVLLNPVSNFGATSEEKTPIIPLDSNSRSTPKLVIEFKSPFSSYSEKYGESGYNIHSIGLKTDSLEGKEIKENIIVAVKKIAHGGKANEKDYELLSKFLVFKKTDSLKIIDIPNVKIQINKDVISEKDETFGLVLEVDSAYSDYVKLSNYHHTVQIENAIQEFDSDAPYRFEIGSNFDFIDGLKISDPYMDINLNIPIGKRKSNKEG